MRMISYSHDFIVVYESYVRFKYGIFPDVLTCSLLLTVNINVDKASLGM